MNDVKQENKRLTLLVLNTPKRSNWNWECWFFDGMARLTLRTDKPLSAEKRTDNKLNSHNMVLMLGVEPGPYWGHIGGRQELTPLHQPYSPLTTLIIDLNHRCFAVV